MRAKDGRLRGALLVHSTSAPGVPYRILQDGNHHSSRHMQGNLTVAAQTLSAQAGLTLCFSLVREYY